MHRAPVCIFRCYSTVTANRQQVPPPSTVSTVRTVMCLSGSNCSRIYSTLCREHSQWAASAVSPRQHLRADAFGITHLIEAPGLENLGKKALRVPVFPVLGVQVAAARPELRRLDRQDGLPHTPDSFLSEIHVSFS